LELGIPYAKTEAARALLLARDATLTPALRALLIMIDGKKPVTDLLPAIKALSLKAEDVHGLLSRGLIEPCAPPPAVRPAPAPEPSASPARSLAAAKFYALGQLTLILGHGDAMLRHAAREVVDQPSLLAWLTACEREVAAFAGDARAARFMTLVRELLPEPATEPAALG
jgi:hypothetical protein